MLLARAGMDVLLVEQGAWGADTLSTLALMRGGVLQLARWGLLDGPRVRTPAIRTTTFHYGRERSGLRIKPRDGVDALYAPRRTVLDPLLADAAQRGRRRRALPDAAVSLQRDRTRRARASPSSRAGDTDARQASIVIGADGLHSTVAKRSAPSLPDGIARQLGDLHALERAR
jgi:menaquinone-9 beta-reductase